MKRQQAHINTVISEKKFLLEPGLFQKYTKALEYDHKIAAKLDQTIPNSFFSSLLDTDALFEKFKINPNKILITKEKLTFGKNFKSGEKIDVQTIVLDLHEQQAENCPLGFLEAVAYGKVAKKTFLKIHKIIVIRGGFSR